MVGRNGGLVKMVTNEAIAAGNTIKCTNDLQISDDEKDNSSGNKNRYEQDPMATDTVVIDFTKTEVIKLGHFQFCESQRQTLAIIK